MNENCMALSKAIEEKDAKKVLEALKIGADPNLYCYSSRGRSTALAYALRVGDVETVKVLIEHGAMYDGKDVLLDLIALGPGAEKVKLLLAAGADPNEATPGGYTALIIAAGRGYTDIVKVLLEAGADVNAASNRTAKSLAYERGYSETAHVIEEWESQSGEKSAHFQEKPRIRKKWWEFWK